MAISIAEQYISIMSIAMAPASTPISYDWSILCLNRFHVNMSNFVRD
jgi:hypothetical protein